MYSRPLEYIFRDLERWVTDHPLAAILLVLVAYGLWWRKCN